MYAYSNNGNHLHAAMKLSQVRNWPAYIRELTSEIVKLLKTAGLLGAREKFFLGRPFTRIVRGWKKAYQALIEYIHINNLEADNVVTREQVRWMREFQRQFVTDS